MSIRTRKGSIMAGVVAVAMTAAAATSAPALAAGEENPGKIQAPLRDFVRPDNTPEGIRELFDTLDDNKDGVIDSGEWRSQKMFVFYARDISQNYLLNREEIPGIAVAVFESADTDGDGLMSGFEFNQAKFTQFSTVDLDGDQQVTFDEFLAFIARIETGKEGVSAD